MEFVFIANVCINCECVVCTPNEVGWLKCVPCVYLDSAWKWNTCSLWPMLPSTVVASVSKLGTDILILGPTYYLGTDILCCVSVFVAGNCCVCVSSSETLLANRVQ
jgi:hypothetical protein